MLLTVSRCGLNPFFALLAQTRTCEVMTTVALLMDAAGLSMAMGAGIACFCTPSRSR